MKMYNSIFGFEDFNRYIIGTNNNSRSNDYFKPDEEGKYKGVLLNDIKEEMSYYIMNVFGWNDRLGHLDNGKYSRDRSHNDQERIGKKFQWLAWFRVNAHLMDTCRTSKEQYFFSRDEAEEEDLATTPFPWCSSEVSRFDPTLDMELRYKPEAGLTGVEIQPIKGKNEKDWIKKNEYLPDFRFLARQDDGVDYVMLMGYDTAKEDNKETFLFSNAGFVKKEDADKFATWAKVQNFYGRWMPEHRGLIEFLWNDYPWADVYKNAIEHEYWSRSHDCPCDMQLSYEAQLQEDWEGIGRENEFLSTAYMPCVEMMEQMGLYCSEVRGVVKMVADGSVAALNTGHGNCINGLFVRRDVLNDYLERNGYVMFYYVLGEKLLRIGEMNSIMKDLSAAYQYQPAEDIAIEIQRMRVIEREIPKPAKASPARIKALKEKNEVEGLTTREMIDLAKMESEMTDADFLKMLEDLPDDDDEGDEDNEDGKTVNKQ